MITFEDYLEGASVDISDSSDEALYERGKFLVEYVDNLGTDLNSEKLEYLISESLSRDEKTSRLVVSNAPGSGKTTAMRQFIVNNPSTTGVVAMNRMDDIEKFYYDIISNILYLNKKPEGYDSRLKFPISRSDKYVLYDSNNKKSISLLKRSSWIFCTHQRLLTDPESLLYVRSQGGEIVNYQVPRDTLFIDELPSQTYIGYNYAEVLPMLAANSFLSVQLGVSPDKVTDQDRFSFIESLLSSNDNIMRDSIDEALGKRLNLKSLKFTSDKDKIERVTSKFYEIFNYCTKYSFTHRLKFNNETKSYDYPNYITYYSILNFSIKNIIIFDGTADILLRDSGWKLIKSNSRREVKINKLTKVKTNVSRTKSSLDDIIRSFTDVIMKIDEKYDGKKNLLIYTWKSKKSQEENEDSECDIIEKLSSNLKKKGLSKFNIISYKSGKEKSTNDYIKSEVVIILGKFFIPNSAIKEFNEANEINETNPITTEDYTRSLIVQLLYRSKARVSNEGIDLYIDDSYKDDFIKKLTDSVKCSTYYKGEEVVSSFMSEHNKSLIESQLKLIKLDPDKKSNFYEIPKLKELIGMKSNRSSKQILKRVTLDGLIDSKVIKEGKGKGSKTIVEIINPLYKKKS